MYCNGVNGMSNVLKDLELLGGIHHSCLVQGETLLESTFPDILADNLSAASRVIQQIFMAIDGMESSHKEVSIELEENLLITYRVTEDIFLTLLTDKEVNLALINTSVRSAMARIKAAVSPSAPAAARPSAQPAAVAAQAAPGGAGQEIELLSLMEQLKEGLAEYIGPAATIIFDDAYANWKATHGVYKSKLAELIKALAIEIDDKGDRSRFLQSAVNLVRASSARQSR